MINDKCINWTGQSMESHGNIYGVIDKSVNGKRFRILAHRAAYEEKYGPIKKGNVVDHLCRNGLCVNPKHLEQVSNKENILRGESAPAKNFRKTHCKNGHELTLKNIWNRKGRRACKICDKNRDRSGRTRLKLD